MSGAAAPGLAARAYARRAYGTAAAARPAASIRVATAAAALGVLIVLSLAALAGIGSTLEGMQGAAGGGAGWEGPSAFARRDIPPAYLSLYERAGARWGIDWAVIAGIGRLECDHGRDPDPSCHRAGAVNGPGAGGPMQFIASTWARYGTDGDADGRIDRWDASDAIFSAGRYLRAAGAPQDYERAIWAYNHAGWYVQEVERWAARYRGAPAPAEAAAPALSAGGDSALAGQTSTVVRYVAGSQARLLPGDGHVAMLPLLAPPVVQAMLVAGNELQSLAYGPGGHPDPRGSSEEDCSSSVNYLLFRAGLRPIGEIVRLNPLAQDYVDWGDPGPGRWVTIYSADSPTPHTFITVAGLRLDTSHDGTDIGPNRGEDGPRWRLFGEIPTWARWSVRHPPGL